MQGGEDEGKGVGRWSDNVYPSWLNCNGRTSVIKS